MSEEKSLNFIEEIIEGDLKTVNTKPFLPVFRRSQMAICTLAMQKLFV